MHHSLKMCFHVNPDPSSSKRVFESINENSQDQDGEIEPRRSKRARIGKSFGPGFLTICLKGNLKLSRRQ